MKRQIVEGKTDENHIYKHGDFLHFVLVYIEITYRARHFALCISAFSAAFTSPFRSAFPEDQLPRNESATRGDMVIVDAVR